ncbi:MAG TPA: SPW repeat protein, partial [Steroidobacteraceae bacterium]
LAASPWVFDYSGRSAVVGSVIVGAVIALLAAIRLASLHNSMGLSGINLVLALWTMAAPWVCGYAGNAGGTANNVIVGAVIAVLAVWSASATVADERHPPRAAAH